MAPSEEMTALAADSVANHSFQKTLWNVYNNLLTSTLLHNGCGNSCVSNVSTNLEGIVTYCDHLVKSNSVTSFCIDLLNFDHITFRNFVLIFLQHFAVFRLFINSL